MRTGAAALFTRLKHHRTFRYDVGSCVLVQNRFEGGMQIFNRTRLPDGFVNAIRNITVSTIPEPFAAFAGRHLEQHLEIDGCRRAVLLGNLYSSRKASCSFKAEPHHHFVD